MELPRCYVAVCHYIGCLPCDYCAAQVWTKVTITGKLPVVPVGDTGTIPHDIGARFPRTLMATAAQSRAMNACCGMT